jgi:hypothetical protein
VIADRGRGQEPDRRILELDDILDLRAYERVRTTYRRQVMERKRRRRVAIGPLMTAVFECFDTVRFQVQEMARVERILTDEGIQAELDTYNPLIPGPGALCATLFIELTTDEDLRTWLPKLVGIEHDIAVVVGAPGDPGCTVVPSVPEAGHAGALTRQEVTPAVHYLRFCLDDELVARFAAAPVALEARHAAYQARADLTEATRMELLGDLRGLTAVLPMG